MIKHGMTVLKAAVEHLKPGQISVIAMDPPLYALAKQVQWCCPETMGDESMLIMLGGLHIEMAAFRRKRLIIAIQVLFHREQRSWTLEHGVGSVVREALKSNTSQRHSSYN